MNRFYFLLLMISSGTAALLKSNVSLASQRRCVVTKVSGQVALYSPPELSTIQLDPEALPANLWSFDDNGGVGAYFKLPEPMKLISSQSQHLGVQKVYMSQGLNERFEIDVMFPVDAFPAPTGSIKIWILATTKSYGRGHILIECLPL